MTVQRYNTPNHPRWDARTTDAPTRATVSRQRYGSRYCHGRHRNPEDHRPEDHHPEHVPESTPALLSREATGDDSTVELRETKNRVCITTELPDCSLDDVQVSVSGASVRIQTDSSDADSPRDEDCIDRTITLAETVDAAEVAVVYDDPTLSVIVPHEYE